MNDMLRWIILAVALSTAACRAGAIATPTVEPTASPTEATPSEIAEVSAEGVTLSLRMPDGWQSIPNDYGILLAEHTELNVAGAPSGILVFVFVQGTVELDLDTVEEGNSAYRLLTHVSRRPDASLNNATISQTVPLELGAHEAAYYLLSDGHGNKTLVLAMAAAGNPDTIVVCNVSASREDAGRIREVLPTMLANLSIDGQPVDMRGLEHLPDPLVFPEHRRDHHPPEATREAGAGSTSYG